MKLSATLAILLAVSPGAFQAWGVDFGNMRYAVTPCETSPAVMKAGKYTYDGLVTKEGTNIDAGIEQVTSGTVSGAKLAAVVFQCAPPKGCYNEAHLYAVRDGKPIAIKKIGSLYDGCPDPDEWFHVRFTPRFLYADVRDQGKVWVVTTYRFTGGKLAAVYSKRHTRS